ncbi:NAD-dependent epimerase/dehydratase family protein, partial [bacterium]|nr:NAD-dependent epimerase/dehydratase family protein [bacterium]
NQELLDSLLPGHEIVFHFCDNSDIQFAASHPDTYMDQNVMGMFNLLQLMRKHGIKKIAFPSSTTVFGDATVVPTPESYGPLRPMNLYGSAKVACEALASGFAYTYDLQAWIFRFVGIVGPRMDHGVIFDFVKKLHSNPERLDVLGDGTQMRNFLIVEDCVDAIWKSIQETHEKVNFVHIGNTDDVSIRRVAEIVREVMGLSNTQLAFADSKRGWKGDALTNMISCDTLNRLGWSPKIKGAERTVYHAATRIVEHGRKHGIFQIPRGLEQSKAWSADNLASM